MIKKRLGWGGGGEQVFSLKKARHFTLTLAHKIDLLHTFHNLKINTKVLKKLANNNVNQPPPNNIKETGKCRAFFLSQMSKLGNILWEDILGDCLGVENI